MWLFIVVAWPKGPPLGLCCSRQLMYNKFELLACSTMQSMLWCNRNNVANACNIHTMTQQRCSLNPPCRLAPQALAQQQLCTCTQIILTLPLMMKCLSWRSVGMFVHLAILISLALSTVLPLLTTRCLLMGSLLSFQWECSAPDILYKHVTECISMHPVMTVSAEWIEPQKPGGC